MSENREILKGLDDLLDGAGNKFGPMILDELQDRLSIAVKKFDLELKGILELSFRNYHIQHDQIKMLMDQNCNPIKEVENKKSISIDSDIPQFIKKFDEKESI